MYRIRETEFYKLSDSKFSITEDFVLILPKSYPHLLVF